MGFLGLFTWHKPKIKVKSTKKDGLSGWIKCSRCEEMVHSNELEENAHCCPKCEHHYPLSAIQRIELLTDEGTFKALFNQIVSKDPLNFVDSKPYVERLAQAKTKTGRNEAALTGVCQIGETQTALGVLDFEFMGGSMGSAVGERIALLIEHAIAKKLPVVLVSSSGGARMQESIFSLMQMAKTAAALAQLHHAGLPFISVLTNPTTGGVTASFASLGDIIIAEPDALIGFAGPRVVQQTMGQKLPDAAQKSEFLLEKGMIDCIVKRKELKEKICFFIQFLMSKPPVSSKLDKQMASDKLDDLIAVSQKQREKNKIKVS